MAPSPPGPAQPHPNPLGTIPCRCPASPCPQECERPLAPGQLLCHSPAFPFESKGEVVLGNLSVLLDCADGRWLFRLRYFPRPKVIPLEQEGRLLRLKPDDDEIEVHVRGALG